MNEFRQNNQLGKAASYANPTMKAKSDYKSGWIYNKMFSALQTRSSIQETT